jgi:hypothetical protein
VAAASGGRAATVGREALGEPLDGGDDDDDDKLIVGFFLFLDIFLVAGRPLV